MFLKNVYYYILISRSGLFDQKYYLETHPDVREADINPLMHFIRFGWKERRNPSVLFNAIYYMETNPDVRNANINYLVHYIHHGKKEGRRTLSLESIDGFRNQNQTTSESFARKRATSDGGRKGTCEAQSNSNPYEPLYNDYINTSKSIKSNEYVEKKEKFVPILDPDVKYIAFYLPQFYPFPENDLWWGRGFTEWTNVSKAVPQFVGHYQPHLPGELSFYDLRVPEVQERQVELARNYGLFGFCFYYYWFNGKRLLEQPLDQFINNPNIEFPFCLCWANENWTRRWDGQENDILIGQNHSPKSDISFIKDLKKYILNKNYIMVNNRPLLIVYRPSLLPEPLETTYRWREYAKSSGWGDLYLVAAQTFGHFNDPRQIGFDAAVEFPPHTNPLFPYNSITNEMDLLNKGFEGTVYDFRDLILSFYYNSRTTQFPLYKTVSPGWDNEPRKSGKGTSFIRSTPNFYKAWLEDASKYALSKSATTDPIVFINAWNEWGEGAHLEPDRKYGYAYLEATQDVLENLNTDETINWRIQNAVSRKHDTAVILHLYYPEIWENIKSYLNQLDGNFDLFVSIPKDVDFDTQTITQIYSNSYFFRCENRGRDIAPFLNILPIVINHGYQFALKLHTKKTIHRTDGIEWRQDVLNKLIGSKDNIDLSKNLLKNENVGIVAPAGHVLPSTFYWGLYNESIMNKKHVAALSTELSIPNHEFPFVAGSMFWFKPSALKSLLKLKVDISSFEPEFGQKDGTLANAFERFIGLTIQENGFNIFEIDEYGNTDKVIYEEIIKRNHYAYAVATYNGQPFIQPPI